MSSNSQNIKVTQSTNVSKNAPETESKLLNTEEAMIEAKVKEQEPERKRIKTEGGSRAAFSDVDEMERCKLDTEDTMKIDTEDTMKINVSEDNTAKELEHKIIMEEKTTAKHINLVENKKVETGVLMKAKVNEDINEIENREIKTKDAIKAEVYDDIDEVENREIKTKDTKQKFVVILMK